MKAYRNRRGPRRGMAAVEVLMSIGTTSVAAFAFYFFAEQVSRIFTAVVSLLVGWPFS